MKDKIKSDLVLKIENIILKYINDLKIVDIDITGEKTKHITVFLRQE